METPHIQFTWSSDVLTTILDSLGIQGLGSFNKTTELYSAWPDGERWALYTSKIRQWMPALPSKEECEAIEKKLSAVESAFNAYLAGADTGNLPALQTMIEQLEEIEASIVDRDFSIAYPYFARWFTLSLAVFKAFMNHENRAGQLRLLKLWWNGRRYLERVFQSAYTERANQITTLLTGAFLDRVYVRDERTGMSLTSDVPIGGEDEIALRNLHRFLRCEAGWQYIQEISLEENATILVQARNALTVTAESRTQQEGVLDASLFWREKRKTIENELAEQRKACGTAFDRLIAPGSRAVSSPEQKGVGGGELLTRGLERSGLEKSATGDAALEITIDIVSELIPTAIDMIPFVGPLISSVFNLFLGFLTGNKPNPWEEFERKMEFLVRDQISGTVADKVRNDLQGFDKTVKSLLQEYRARSHDLTPSQQNEFIARASNLITAIEQYQYNVLMPASSAYYKSAPYYEHFFILYIIALDLGKTIGVETFDFVQRRTQLYEATNTFINQAFNGILQERREDIQVRDDSTCFNRQHKLHDRRLKVDYTWEDVVDSLDNLVPVQYPKNITEGMRDSAGLISAIQLLRGLSARVQETIRKDTQTTFDKTRIKITYNNLVTRTINGVRESVDKFSTELDHLVQGPPAPFVLALKNWREQMHGDIFRIASASTESFLDFKETPMTVFHISLPIARYYIVNKKSGKVLDVAGGSTDNMANIQQYSRADVEQQKWQLEDVGEDYFFLVSKKSGRVVAVDNANSNVVQYDKIATADDQKWKLESPGDGYFYFINKKSGKALEVQVLRKKKF